MQNVIVLEFATDGDLQGKAISGKKEWEGLLRLATDHPDYEVEWYLDDDTSVVETLGELIEQFKPISVDDLTDDEVIEIIEENGMVPFADGYMFATGTIPQVFEQIVEELDEERFEKYFPELATFFAEQTN